MRIFSLEGPVYNTVVLEGPVHNFFLGQSLIEAGEPWPFGERKHGFEGLLESYGELIGTTEVTVISKYLECLSKKEIKGHWDCPCGSGKRIRDCHKASLMILRRRLPQQVAARALSRLRGLSWQ